MPYLILLTKNFADRIAYKKTLLFMGPHRVLAQALVYGKSSEILK